jgi:alpha,alpha-trehalase
MLFYLLSADELTDVLERLGYDLDGETIPKNVDYYLGRTSHGSTLSRVVHSWVLARSDRVRSWRLFTEALASDVTDIQGGTTEEGIHLGAMAGTVDLILRGYTGIETREDVLWLNPCLPEEVSRLRMCIRYRGHPLELEITGDRVWVQSPHRVHEPLKVGFDGEVHVLEADEVREFALGC